MRHATRAFLLALAFGLSLLPGSRNAAAQESAPNADSKGFADVPGTQDSALYGQFTNVTQHHNDFRSPYSGANSLSATGRTEETSDATLFLGVRAWQGSEFWINPEIDQGYGLDDTLGVAGFPSGEAYKIGANAPYLRVPRAFLRQTIDLGGTGHPVAGVANTLAGQATDNSLVLTVGKYSVVDIFDTNSYAHDPRSDFLNWSVIDAGAFDYAADPWGFTYGAAAEWSFSQWTLRGGYFAMSPNPNGKLVRPSFAQSMSILELERRFLVADHPGKIKVLAFVDRARMGSYDDAVAQAALDGQIPATFAVRRAASKTGETINIEQELSRDVGVFLRASANDGRTEAYEFTEINASLSLGASIRGRSWSRADDVLGIAAVQNRLSSPAQRYFEAGGLGILIGDGRLNYGTENILEVYYAAHLVDHLTVGLDFQQVWNPAYNRDRGPVSVIGTRVHAEF